MSNIQLQLPPARRSSTRRRSPVKLPPPAGAAPPLLSLDPIGRAILDALPAHIAVVNAEGTILLINAAWAQFARDNGDPELHRTGVGANYFAVCQEVSGPAAAEAQQVLAGMFSILRGEADGFECEYPCHSATEERWFLMRVRPLVGSPGGLVLSHENIIAHRRTERVDAEARARARPFVPLEEERRRFERLFSASGTRVTAQTFGLGAVRDNHPEFFRACVQRYEAVLDLALEQRVYRVEHPLAEQIRLLSEQLGFLRAGPRDVIDVHRAALRNKTVNTPASKVQAYTQEGRLLVVKLMGDLVSYYRALATGKRLPPHDQDTTRGGGETG